MRPGPDDLGKNSLRSVWFLLQSSDLTIGWAAFGVVRERNEFVGWCGRVSGVIILTNRECESFAVGKRGGVYILEVWSKRRLGEDRSLHV